MDVFPGITWVSRTSSAPPPAAPGPAVPAAGPARWNLRRWGNTFNRAETFRTSRAWEQMLRKKEYGKANNNLSVSYGSVLTVVILYLGRLLWGVLETLHHTSRTASLN